MFSEDNLPDYNFHTLGNEILFVNVPISLSKDREVIWAKTSTQNVKKHFDKIMENSVALGDSKSNIENCVIAGMLDNQQKIKKILNEWGGNDLYNNMKKNTGSFIQITTPFTKVLTKGMDINKKCISGMLLWSEQSRIFLFSYYAVPINIYNSYLLRLKQGATPVPPSYQAIRTEIIMYLTHGFIPRIKKIVGNEG